MGLIAFLFIVAIIVIYGLIMAFSKIVETGGNPSKVMSDLIKGNKEDTSLSQDIKSRSKSLSNLFRTICGLLLGLLMITPSIFGTPRGGGKPVLEIPPEWRVPSYVVLLLLTILAFILTWIVDRDSQ